LTALSGEIIMSLANHPLEGTLAKKEDQAESALRKQDQEIEQLKRQIEMLDQRLDNIDSMVTAVAERIMSRPVTFNVTCSHCGKDIEIAILGTTKPSR